MDISFRALDQKNADEIDHIARIDVGIPMLFDSDFRDDEKTINERKVYLQEKFGPDDFAEVAIHSSGAIVGYHLVRKVAHMNDLFAGQIQSLWVLPEFRRQGIATTLTQRGEQWAKVQKLDHIFTWTHANNEKMISLNKELGFEVTVLKLRKQIRSQP